MVARLNCLLYCRKVNEGKVQFPGAWEPAENKVPLRELQRLKVLMDVKKG